MAQTHSGFVVVARIISIKRNNSDVIWFDEVILHMTNHFRIYQCYKKVVFLYDEGSPISVSNANLVLFEHCYFYSFRSNLCTEHIKRNDESDGSLLKTL